MEGIFYLKLNCYQKKIINIFCVILKVNKIYMRTNMYIKYTHSNK